MTSCGVSSTLWLRKAVTSSWEIFIHVFFWRKSKLLSPTMMKVDPWMDRSTTEERRKSNYESNWGHGHGGCRSSNARSRHHSLVVAAASLIDKACTLRRRPCLYCRKLRGTERSPSHGTRDMDLAPTVVRIHYVQQSAYSY